MPTVRHRLGVTVGLSGPTLHDPSARGFSAEYVGARIDGVTQHLGHGVVGSRVVPPGVV